MIKQIFFIIISIFFATNIYAKTVNCELYGYDIARTGVTSIALRVADNGACYNYKFYEVGKNSFAFKNEGMVVKLKDRPTIDPYSRSKIRSIVSRDNDIIFNFDYPFVAERFIENDKIIFIIKPHSDVRLIDNKPIVTLTNLRCDKSLPAISITTDTVKKFNYNSLGDDVTFIDLYDTTLDDKAVTSRECKSEVEYEYLDNPTRLRLLFKTGRYKNMKASSQDATTIIINAFPEEPTIYITKLLVKKNTDNETLEIFLSNGILTRVVELSASEFAIELDDNIAKIMNLQYERRFSDSYIESISKQRVGVKDRLIVRVEKDKITKIEKTANGVLITVTK